MSEFTEDSVNFDEELLNFQGGADMDFDDCTLLQCIAPADGIYYINT